MRIRHASALLVAGCALATLHGAAQAPSEGSPFAGGAIAESSPAPDGSAQPHLAVDRTGRVRLSWLARREGGSGHRFQFAEFQGNEWSAPVTIAEGDRFIANWADVPSIFSTSSDVIVAHWLERGDTRASYGIRVSQSTNGGKTWSAPETPHRDGTAGEHGFVSFFEGPGATVGLAWLDGRLVAEHGREGAMSLRATTLAAGKPTEDVLVDARVCDCCPTSAARTDSGVIVAYRDRSDDEIRDIAVARLVNGKWTTPTTVHADRWQINACPVNGPAVAAIGRDVAVAWFTVAGGTARVKVAFSNDGGATFSAPAVVESEATFGRLGLAMLDGERALVSAIEKVNGADRIVVREARRGGRIGAPVVVAATTFERTSGFPRLAVSGRRVWFAWTDVTSGPVPKVRVASARLR